MQKLSFYATLLYVINLYFAAFSWKCRRVGHLPEDCTVKTQSGNSTVGKYYLERKLPVFWGFDVV